MMAVYSSLSTALDQHGTRFLRFGVVGVSGVLLNMAILYLLVQFGGVHHLIAAAIASEVSVLSNFALNDHWTFRSRRPEGSWLVRALQYNGVALTGMVISLMVLAVLTDRLGIHYLLANLAAIGAATLSNYTLNCHFTWRIRRPMEMEQLRVSSES